jgi:hypothetical protein
MLFRCTWYYKRACNLLNKHRCRVQLFACLILVFTGGAAQSQEQENDTTRQVDLVDYFSQFFKVKNTEEKRENKKFRFSVFPTGAGNGSGALVTSFNITFIQGHEKNTNVSSIYFIPYISFSNQYGFILRPNVWLSRNSWNFSGEWFLLRYPQYTWGLGGNSSSDDKSLVNYYHVRFHQNILKGLPYNLAAGLGYALDHHYNISVEENEDGNVIEEYPVGEKENTISSGILVPLIFDKRYNSNNPPRGGFINLTWRFNSTALGSDHDWQSVFLDLRKYFSLSRKKQNIIALRSYYWSIISGQVPYLDLPANGWEPGPGSSARGLQQNRYRSNGLLYFESEYRFDITANGFLGGVLFANLTSASEYNSQNYMYWHPAAGFGLRFKLNKFSRTNLTFDCGFSKEFFTVYVNLGEVF